MRLQEGPAFGALIIGAGVGYLMYNKTGNLAAALALGAGLAIADYIFLVWISSLKKKTK